MTRPLGNPPLRISSRPGIPVGVLSTVGIFPLPSDFGVRIFRPWYKSLRILPLQSCFESYCYLHLTAKVTPCLAELRPRDYYRASCSESYGKRRVSCGVRCGASKKETIRSHVTATATNLRNRPDPSTHFPNCSKAISTQDMDIRRIELHPRLHASRRQFIIPDGARFGRRRSRHCSHKRCERFR